MNTALKMFQLALVLVVPLTLFGEVSYTCYLSSDDATQTLAVPNDKIVDVNFEGVTGTIRLDDKCPIIRLVDTKSGAEVMSSGGTNVDYLGASLKVGDRYVSANCVPASIN